MAALILKSSDIDRTIEWYRAAGFELTGRQRADGRDWCSLVRGEVALEFLAGDTPWSGEPAMTGCVYVPVADANATLGTLRAPAASEWGVETRPWGAREIVLRDPDGYFVTLTQPA